MTHPTSTLRPAAAPGPAGAGARPAGPGTRPAGPGTRPDIAGTRPVEPLLRHLVGAILRQRRADQRRTLREVAESARVSVAYLSEVERGRKEASSEVLVAVCRALGLRLVDLVGAAHAELARAEGRVVVDLTAPAAADLVATSTEHELATVTRLTGRASSSMPVATASMPVATASMLIATAFATAVDLGTVMGVGGTVLLAA